MSRHTHYHPHLAVFALVVLGAVWVAGFIAWVVIP